MPERAKGGSAIFGNGEMHSLIREKDWSTLALGPVSNWSPVLLLALNTILNSQFPQMMYWGKDNTFFYNDAYKLILASSGKHPTILGLPAEQAFPEAAAHILELIEKVKKGEQVSLFESVSGTGLQNENTEDVYRSFSYSPVYDSGGNVAAVLGSVHENSGQAPSSKNLVKLNDQLQQAIAVAQLGVWEYGIAEDEFTASPLLQEWLGLPVKNKYPLSEGFSMLDEDSAEAIRRAISQNVTQNTPIELAITTKPINGRVLHLYSKGETQIIENGAPTRLWGTIQNLTDWVEHEKHLHETESRLSVLADNISQLAWMTDETGYIFWYNKRWFEYTGTTLEEMEGWGWQKVHHPDHVERVTERLKKCIAAGEDWEDTFPLKGADGNYKWFLSRAKVIRSKEGAIRHWFGTNTDVTKQKEAEEDLANREKQFRLLADSMPQFIWMASADGIMNYYNKAVFDYSGMSRQEIDNIGWLDIVHPDEREANLTTWIDSLNTGNDFLFEHRFRRYDGEYRWQLSRAVPQYDAEGNIQVWVGTSTDIHDIKVMELQKNNFISLASHELKTPVTSLKGYIQLLQEDEDATAHATVRTSLNTMERQVDRLTGLINDLLDITRIESGTLNVVLTPQPLLVLIQQVIQENKTLSRNHRIELLNEQEAMVMADKARISQVMANLLNNAIKYSPGQELVRVSMELTASTVSVSVQDFGIGISGDNQQKIFDNFFRVQGKNEQTFAGFGIGLFLVSEILRGHNGTISVESELGKGSVFTFTLPRLNNYLTLV